MRILHIDTSARTLSGSGTGVAILPGKLQIKKAADIFLVKKAKMRYTIYTYGHTKL